MDKNIRVLGTGSYGGLSRMRLLALISSLSAMSSVSAIAEARSIAHVTAQQPPVPRKWPVVKKLKGQNFKR